MSLGNIMLNEKVTYHMRPFIWIIQDKQIQSDRVQTDASQGLGSSVNEKQFFEG